MNEAKIREIVRDEILETSGFIQITVTNRSEDIITKFRTHLKDHEFVELIAALVSKNIESKQGKSSEKND